MPDADRTVPEQKAARTRWIDRVLPLPEDPVFRDPLTLWSRIQALARVLRPAWLPTLLSLAVFLLLQVEQTREVFYSFVTNQNGNGFPQHHLWGMAALAGFCLATWYFSRVSLYFRYWFTPLGSELSHESWRQYFPRVIGILPSLSAAAVFLRCGAPAGTAWIALMYALLSLVLALFFVYRRRVWRSINRPNAFAVSRFDRSIHRDTLRTVCLIEILCLALLVAFCLSKVTAPQWVGPLAIVLTAMTAWTAVGSVAVGFFFHRRWPSPVILLILYAAIVGMWNDNHALDDNLRGKELAGRTKISDHIDSWLAYRKPIWNRADSKIPYPVFIVTAEGGGIRAAYWTASALDQIQSRHPAFACHLLALSGVSGGSLGSATFVASLADQLPAPTAASQFVPCGTDDPLFVRERADVEPVHTRILSRDFLGPVFAGWLFPDLVQRVLSPTWGRFTLPDRARFIEATWEEAWIRGAGTDRFAGDFMALWARTPSATFDRSLVVPSLFLNATWVETGGRAVISNLDLSSPHFAGADDFLAGICHPLTLSTAVHASARFSYISPAGTVEWSSDGRKGCLGGDLATRRVVDGGYFENSGAVTAEELLHLFNEACGETCENGDKRKIVPVVLMLSNDDLNPNQDWVLPSEQVASPTPSMKPTGVYQTGPKPQDPAKMPDESRPILTGVTSPILALFQTRSARGYYAEDHLRQQAGLHHTIRVQLRRSGNERVPLGWLLSDRTRAVLDSTIASDPALSEIGCLLRPFTRIDKRDIKACPPQQP